jgi:hypothetical protein
LCNFLKLGILRRESFSQKYVLRSEETVFLVRGIFIQKDSMRFLEKTQREISKIRQRFLSRQEFFLVMKKGEGVRASTERALIRLKTVVLSVVDSFFVVEAPARKQTVIEAESLEEFLSSYAVSRKGSYGTAYLRRRHAVTLLVALKKQTLFVMNWVRRLTWRTALLLLVVAVISGATPGALSAPQSVSIDTRAEWETGTQSATTSLSATDAIELESAGSWSERVWAPTKEPVNAGHSSVLVGNYLYATRGQSDKAFWRYDTEQNIWENLPDLPHPAYLGSDMSYVSATGDIYMIFGGYSLKYYKYSLANQTWTRLADLLDAPYSGASIENDGTDIYFMRGNTSTDFFKYDVANDQWLNRAPVTATVGVGGDLINGQDGFLYALRGTPGVQMYKYNLSSNVWSAGTSITTAPAGEQRAVFANNYIYVLRAGSTNTFYRYNVTAGTWLAMTGTNEFAPMTTNYPSLSYSSAENKIYAIRGLNTTDMWKFDPALGANGQWVGPKQVLDGTVGLNTGSDLMWNGVSGAGAYVYATRGGGTNAFYRYDITNNSWASKAVLPYALNTDTKGVWCNGNAYYAQPGSVNFYRYTEDAWTTFSSAPNTLPAAAGAGAGLACASDNSVYAIRGGGTNSFYRWVSGTGWSTLSTITIGTVNYYPNIGARTVAIGTDIYVLPGNGETAMLKYNGTWSTVKATPFAQYLGTDITVSGGKIYALAGYYKNEFWEYNPGTDTWRLLPANQAYTFARGPYSGASIEYAGGTSFYGTPGQGLADMWSYTASASNYVSSGTYLSKTFDLSHVESWGNFTPVETKPASTSVTYETQSSDDQNTWSGWQAVSGTTIQSPTARYIQVRITLSTSDGVSTPTVGQFTIAYNSEETAPVNPSVINAYSANGGGETLSSGTAYAFDHPYFQWSGATDGGSGVSGYYVYFGPNASADPVSDGVFQTALNYTSTIALEQTVLHAPQSYYLRIKTKDSNGNIAASAWDAFTYAYDGASPTLTESVTSQADFDAGTLSSTVSQADGSVSLTNTSGLWNQVRLSLLPGNVGYGGELVLGACAENSNHCLYTAAGNSTNIFYRYEIETDTWTTKAVIPTLAATMYYGGTLIEGPPGYLYLTKGNLQSSFLQYTIATNTWTSVDSAPKNFDYGGNMSYDGERYIYAMPGNDDAFYRYDTCNGESGCTRGWTSLPNADFGNPNTVNGQFIYEGADSVYDGRNNIYAIQGNLLPYFAKYSIHTDPDSGETQNTWTPLTPAPEGFYDGGTLVFDETTQSIFAVGGNNATTANMLQNFYKYDIESNTWSTLPNVPALVSRGASLALYDGYLYLQRGGGTTNFYRYHIESSTWELPKSGFFGPSIPTGNGTGVNSFFPYTTGTFMAADNTTNLYIVRGGADNTFGRYNVSTGTFHELARLPVGAMNGASILFNETESKVYYVPGVLSTTRTGFTTYFFVYDVATNVWSEITTDRPPGQVTTGSSMTYDGSRYIYLTQGGALVWWRYDTQGSSGSRWSVMTAMTAGACGGAIGDGSKIVYKSGYVYVTRAGTTTNVCRFQIGGSWVALGALPAAAGAGSSLTDSGDGYLYVARGAGTNDYYRYNTAQATPGSWQTVSSTPALKVPALVTTGGIGAYSNNKNWIISGAGTNSYADGLYSYLVGSSGGSTGFVKTGTFTTAALNLVSVYHFTNLVVNYTTPANTFVTLETRTSADGSSWSSWTAALNDSVVGTTHTLTIDSPANPFIQVRATLSSSDQVFSPNITDITVRYYQDVDAPSNPSSVTAYTDVSHITTIAPGAWNSQSAPSFVWPAAKALGGAIDTPGGSGIAGYYVYFGTSGGADAFGDGSFQTATTYTASGLTPGQAYYLKIKAVDYGGMIPAANYEAFTYQYDTTAPTNPSSISVTPTGYTASDNYAFLWAADVADDYSGVVKFQYRTDGDAPGVWVDMNDAGAFQVTIPNADHLAGAYQSGKNKFYLRAVDAAGNVSAPLMQEYYYSASAPTPPQNLVATPTTSTDNSFAFSWSAPASFAGDPTKLVYRYSINVLPTPNNTVATSLDAAGPGAFATQKGENLFFVVAEDEATNIEYNNYAVVSFNADTSNPPIPGKVQIFDTSDRENSKYGIAVKWVRPDGLNLANFDGFVVYRSEDNVTFTEIAKTTGSAYVDSGEILLASGDTTLESKLYYYYVKSKDKTSNYSAASSTVSIVPTGKYTSAPKLVGSPSYTLQSFQASFTWATDREASSFIEYGKSISLGETTGQVDSVTSHEVLVKGLDADTKYFYRTKYIDPDGNIGTSDIDTFTTLPPPTISDVTITDIQLYTAYVNWTTNVSATCTLEYGSFSIEEESSGSGHVQRIDQLNPASDYRAQISCIDGDLNTFSSDEYTFRTPEEPVVADVKIENKEDVDLPTIVIAYTTNVPTSTLIYYKAAGNSENHTYLTEELVTEHSAEISDLDPAVEYAVTITGMDTHNIQARPFEQKITTRTDSRPPRVLSNKAMGRVSGRGNNAQASVYIKIETDEPSRLHVVYAKGIVTKSFEQSTNDDVLNTYHLITIPAEAGDVYSYQAEVYDEAGNKTTTDPATVPVEQSKANATEVITRTFLNNFGWMSRLGGN